MVSQLLLYKILQLFLIMVLGFVLVKTKILKSEDSIVLSRLSLYLFMPCVILNAFNVEMNDDILKGLAFSFLVAVLIHIVLLAVDFILKKYCKATNVERASIIYSNAGNLIVPIITYVLGEEWLIYSSGFLIVQIIFLWTHGVGLFCDKKPGPKKILTNINVIAVILGFIMIIFNLRLPTFAGEITSSLAGMLAPAGMITAGMLAASVDFGKMLKNKRLNLKLIVAHVGRAYTESDFGDAFEVLSKSKNILFDFSANTLDTAIAKCIETVGTKRVVFGSDMPVAKMRMYRITEDANYVNVVPRGMYGDVSNDIHMRETDKSEVTCFIYETLLAFKRASEKLGLTREEINDILYKNAERILEI